MQLTTFLNEGFQQRGLCDSDHAFGCQIQQRRAEPVGRLKGIGAESERLKDPGRMVEVAGAQ
jgi:hypothetical protein